MLKLLRITNLILIDTAEISFEAGLNVLSGETGSGKSAIMHALTLIAGERSDTGVIRHGTDKSVIEAVFEIDIPQLFDLLEASGIDHNAEEELIIRREISLNGKSRAFINNQIVQVGLLRQVGEVLFDIVGQHANQRLLSSDKHRASIDLYGELQKDLSAVMQGWTEENALRTHLDQLVQSESQRLRDIEVCQMEVEELLEAKIQDNEEEQLFTEYSRLANAEELAGKIRDITQTLSGERHAIMPQLSRHQQTLEQIVRIDSSLTDTLKAYESAVIELQEISHMLHHYQSRIEHNPARLEEVNERLTLINRLKRKYGPTVSDIQAYLTKTQEKLKRLQNADVEIEELKTALQKLVDNNNKLCTTLTKKRKAAAQKFDKAMVHQLSALNMPKVAFQCKVSPQTRSRYGDDHVEFYLSPNVGEREIPIKECASGGELSRVMLALQALLADKEGTPTLIFDEIDANIGGETASIVGEKLREIGDSHQVLCITHFPQVAKQAQHHLQISKKEISGRTVTAITILDLKNRQQELKRMQGVKG